METLIAIALLALSFFGPGWSSEHKAFWEWQLGRQLEGYEEYRLSRGWTPDGTCPLLAPCPGEKAAPMIAPITLIECDARCVLGGECIVFDCIDITP